MTDEKFIELIHREIDGATTPQESAHLREYLATNAEAEKLYADLTKLTRILDEVKQVDPPSHLKQKIMDSIQFHIVSPKSRESLFTNLFRFTTARARGGYAFALAAGMLIGLVATSWFSANNNQTSSLDPAQLTGTIVTGDFDRGFDIIDSREIESQGVTGNIEIRSGQAMLLVELVVNSTAPAEILIRFDPNNLSFYGFRRHQLQPQGISTGAGFVQMTHTGNNVYTLVFEDRSPSLSPISIGIRTAGGQFEELLRTGPISNDGVLGPGEE